MSTRRRRRNPAEPDEPSHFIVLGSAGVNEEAILVTREVDVETLTIESEFWISGVFLDAWEAEAHMKECQQRAENLRSFLLAAAAEMIEPGIDPAFSEDFPSVESMREMLAQLKESIKKIDPRAAFPQRHFRFDGEYPLGWLRYRVLPGDRRGF